MLAPVARIIWLNGAFGSGKTTTANELVEPLPGARTFDPEIVGFMLRHCISEPVPDFQDRPAWRALVPQVVDRMPKHYGGVLLAPLAVMRRDCLAEILGGLPHRDIEHHHVLLDVRAVELVRRVHTDAIETGARQRRLVQVEGYLECRRRHPRTLCRDAGMVPTARVPLPKCSRRCRSAAH